MSESFARTERVGLCDTAESVGPSAPTLCDGWDVRRLLAHLWVREHSPTGAPGIVISRLAPLTERAMDVAEGRDFADLVAAVRRPRWTLMALAGIDPLVNSAEFFVHHEDIRRAQPDWQPRDLDPRANAILWKLARQSGPLMLRKSPVPIALHRTDTGVTEVVRKGSASREAELVTVNSTPGELLLWLYGRAMVRDLEVTGPAEAAHLVRGLARGV